MVTVVKVNNAEFSDFNHAFESFLNKHAPKTRKEVRMNTLIFISNWGQASALKIANIFKVFGAQSSLMVA